MVLMFGVMIMMTMCMPNMKMDPEQLKAMKDMQKEMKNNPLSSWLPN